MIQQAFAGSATSGRIQLLRSVLASAASFGLDFLVLTLLVELGGLNYLVATGLSFTAGTGFNYFITVNWIFRKSRVKNRKVEFLAYFAFAAIGLAANGAAMFLFTDIVGIDYRAARILAASSIFLLNFAFRKFILFDAGPKGAPRGEP